MPLSQEEIDSYNGSIESFGQAPIAARAKAVAGAAANPEQAAKSLELARASGVHPEIVDLDHENFEEQWKERTAGEAVAADPSLQEYVNGHPLAAKVSNDDYPQLTRLGNAVKGITTHPLGEAWEGFKEGFGKLSTTEDIRKRGYRQDLGPEFAGIQELERSLKAPFDQSTTSPIDLITQGFSGAIHGVARGAGTFLHNVSGGQISPDKAEREIGGLIEWSVMRGDINLAHGTPEFQTKVKEVMDHGLPYVKDGETPPPGIHEVFDKAHKERAKADGEALKEAEREAAKSATKERSPDALEAFLRGPTQDRSIGISAEAVRELYGDEVPAPGDGKLGWVEGLEDQLRTAEAIGGDIEVSLAGWLAKTEPEVQNALHDHVRVRPDGMTLFEGKGPETKAKGLGVLPEEEGAVEAPTAPKVETEFEKAEPLVATTEDLARKEAALAPLVESGETVRLKKIEEQFDDKNQAKYDIWEIHGDRGKIGDLTTSLTPKGVIYVEGIFGRRPGAKGKEEYTESNVFGLRAVAQLARQLQKEYPAAKDIGGYRISGAREKAGTTGWVQIPLKRLLESEKEQTAFAEALGLTPEPQKLTFIPEAKVEGGQPVRGLSGTTAEPLYSFKSKDLLDILTTEHLEDVPKLLQPFFKGKLTDWVGDVDIRVVSKEEMGRIRPDRGEALLGYYDTKDHYIAMNEMLLDGTYSASGVAHIVVHEVTHAATVKAIREDPQLAERISKVMQEVSDFLDETEPETRGRHNYAFKNVEEFVAEAFSNPHFQEVLSTTPISPKLAKELGLSRDTKTMWDAVRNFVAGTIERIIGIRPGDSAMDAILKLGEEFEKKTKIERIAKGEGMDLLSAPDPLFENAKAIGMTKDSFKRYQEKIAKRNEEDEARQLAKATKEAERRQTAEWKAAEKEVHAEVTEQIDQRPDIAADDFLREGPFTDVKTGRLRLNSEALSDEQKAELPKHYYAKGGTDPSALAGYFGFSSGEALVKRLGSLNAIREGLGLDPKEYKKALVDQAVERQMAEKFGNLEQSILEEARDSIRTATQMELLHEETMALGLKAGVEPSLTVGDIKAAIKKEFGTISVSQAKDPMNFVRTSGRAGREVEEALLRGDTQEAFRQKQRQYYSELMVKEAQKLQKEFAKNEKLLKRFAQRQVSTVSQEYTDRIHEIMGKIGSPVKRSVQDLQQAIAGTPLENFVAAKEADLREVPVADFLFDPAFKKDRNALTVGEFRAVDSSLKALAHNGRSELQVEKAGEKADLEKIRKTMVEQLETFEAAKPPPLGQGRGKLLGIPSGAPKKALRTFVAAHLQMETLLNRWDRFDPRGVFNQYVMRPLAESSNHLAKLEREYSKLVMDLKDKENLKETIENPLFIDPLSKTIDNPDGVPFIMSRKHLRAVMANMGNASNLEKLTKGYDVSPEALRLWVDRVAKKEDWDFVQKQGDIFAKLKEESDRMYERLAGIAPESIETTPLDTPHGQYAGWYHPIIYDRLREGGSKKLMGKSGLEEPEYFRATTPAGYTKARTGYTAPLSLELDEVQTRMKQMIHDIAMREAVINAGKIFYDKDVRSAIAKHSFLGPEVKDMLVPYLKDVANHSNIDSAAAHIGAQWSEFFRQNIISTLVGLNPGTVMKHGPTAAMQSLQEVGPLNFAREVKDLLKPGGHVNWKFAMKTSEELQRRHRNYAETLGGGYREAFQEQNLRTIVQHVASYPVAISDLLSAVPTWLAEYRTQMEAGASKGDAIFAADRSIRRAHGSTAMTNRPVVMRGGATAQWFSSVFGFFSHIMNRQVEMVWRAGDTLGKVKNGELSDALADTPKLASSLFAYVIWPALIEEMVSPLTNEEHESWGKWAGKALIKDLSASWIGVRDVTQAILTGHDPSMGLIGTMFKTGSDLSRDIVAEATKGKDRAGKIIEHGAATLGAATGLATAQMGRTGEFAYNVATGKDKPKGMGQWLHGLRYGTSKVKKK